MIQINDASVTYKNKIALANINLHINQGEKLALVGQSGSGKSTLLKLLYEEYRKGKKQATLIPQDYGLVQSLSVFHNVYSGQLNRRSTWYNLVNLLRPLAEPVNQVSKLLAPLNLVDKLHNPVGQLSGGQQQRTSIARAMMHDSDILLADEPVSSLDQTQSQTVMTLLCKQFNTAVFSLHDIDLALAFSDRIIGLKNGKIIINKPTNELTRKQLIDLYEN